LAEFFVILTGNNCHFDNFVILTISLGWQRDNNGYQTLGTLQKVLAVNFSVLRSKRSFVMYHRKIGDSLEFKARALWHITEKFTAKYFLEFVLIK